jgi:hypothetical protein
MTALEPSVRRNTKGPVRGGPAPEYFGAMVSVRGVYFVSLSFSSPFSAAAEAFSTAVAPPFS